MTTDKHDKEEIIKEIKSRAINLHSMIKDGIFPLLEGSGLSGKFIVAGSSLLMNTPNDIDLYPVKDDNFNLVDLSLLEKCGFSSEYIETEQAITIYQLGRGRGTEGYMPVQLCKFSSGSMEDLVHSFDFAHVQVCALCDSSGVLDVYVSDEHYHYLELGSTYYTGSDFPLSSLLRSYKYYERGLFARHMLNRSVLNILFDILSTETDIESSFNGIDPVEFISTDTQSSLMALNDLISQLKSRDI